MVTSLARFADACISEKIVIKRAIASSFGPISLILAEWAIITKSLIESITPRVYRSRGALLSFHADARSISRRGRGRRKISGVIYPTECRWCMRRARRIGARYYRAIRLRKYRTGIGISMQPGIVTVFVCARLYVCARTRTCAVSVKCAHICIHTYVRTTRACTRCARAYISRPNAAILSRPQWRRKKEGKEGERVARYCKSRSSSAALIPSSAQLLRRGPRHMHAPRAHAHNRSKHVPVLRVNPPAHIRESA